MLNRNLLSLTLAAAATLSTSAVAQQHLAWSDEFDGTSLDISAWEYQIGTGCPSLCGWGNAELQYYRAENVDVSGGTLKITAKAENFGGRSYTSARIRTRGPQGFDWTYGRIEARAKLPTGQGLWPAIWMLPTDYVYGGWAASGEIDIMELVGHEPNRVHGTIHYGAPSPGNTFTGSSYTLPSGDFSDDFHVFSIEWDPNQIRWYVDGFLYATQSSWWSSGGSFPAPFDQPFHILLNVAVGGNWPGRPNGSTQFPQVMEIDYVRVYQDGPPPCTSVFDDMDHGNPTSNGWFTFDEPAGGGSISGVAGDVPPVNGGTHSLGASFNSNGAPGYQGGFARTHFQNLPDATHFEFWIDPDASVEGTLSINLQDDDNGDNMIPNPPVGDDDEFQALLSVGGPGSDIVAGGGWQHIIVPFTDFVDDNSYLFGGNGVFDPVATASGGNGQLVNIVIALDSTTGANTTFRTDDWRFTNRSDVIAGTVWDDANEDGIFLFEQGVEGVQVQLVDLDIGSVISTAVTNMNGAYTLTGATEGSLQVRVVPSTLPVGASPTADPDGIGTADQADYELTCDNSVFFQNFGYSFSGIVEFPSSCNGDGGDQAGCTDCPCSNNASPGTIGGCVNSAGTSSRLIGTGDTSISLPAFSTTDVRFQAVGMPPTAFGVLISGNAVAPGNMANPCFGQNSGIQFSQFDGLRCSIQATQRHGGRSADASGVINDSSGPSRVWGGEAQPVNGLAAAGGFAAGQTRYFQINHREDSLLGCMRGLNNSQAVEVVFTP